MGFVPRGEFSSGALDSFELDDGFGPTSLQESTRINGVGLRKSIRDQGVEYELQLLPNWVKCIGHSREDGVQAGPAGKIDPGINFCGLYGEIRLECNLPDASGADSLENWFDPVTWLSDLDETESDLF